MIIFLIHIIVQDIIFMRVIAATILLVVCLGPVVCQDQLYKLHLISQQGGASCLDGSPPGYFLHEGFGQNKNKYLLIFAGGGFCGQPDLSSTLESCYKRSFTNLGSTKYYNKVYDGRGKGLLSPLQKQNQLFYDWTKIGVVYCDGSQFLGHRENPIEYRDKKLFFRGSRNVKQLFKHLDQTFDFYNGDTIIISGISAGGMATYQWSNYLFQNTKKAKVYAMPDSGLFITDYYSPIVGKKLLRDNGQTLLQLVYNSTQMPDQIQSCLKQVGFDVVDCVNAGNYARFLKAPMFMIQSPYDAWSLKYILGVPCLKNKQPYSLADCPESVMKVIEDYRLKTITELKSLRNNRKDIGVWGPACAQHGFEDGQAYTSQAYTVNKMQLMESISKFLQNPNQAPWLLDQQPWPNNKGCSGMSLNMNRHQTVFFD